MGGAKEDVRTEIKAENIATKETNGINTESEESMNSYLGRIKTCSDSLKEAGCEIKDENRTWDEGVHNAIWFAR